MKFLIAGLGSIGRRHLKNLISLGEKDIILYRTKLSTLSDDELKEFQTETDLYSALAHKPDAVIISNPTSLHFDVAIPAAEAGCHILLEKPVSHSLERINELKSALRRGGGKVLVGFQYRFHPTLQIAFRLISEDIIGRPVSARAHWGEYLPEWHPWEDYHKSYSARADLGGGVVLTLCHPIDYLHWLLGQSELMCAAVCTLGDLDLKVEDTAEILLRFSSGAIGSVHLDYIQRPTRHYLEIIGTKGTILWNNSDGLLSVFYSDNSKWEYFRPPDGFEKNHMFVDEMRHFISITKSADLPFCTLDDGIHALELVLQTMSFKENVKKCNQEI